MSNIDRRTAAWALVALTAFGQAATAADLGGAPSRRPVYEPTYESRRPLDIERWTGFYFGATYGYADGQTGVSGGSGSFDVDQSGGLGTLFAGYNHQIGQAVIGLEADLGGLGSFDGANGIGPLGVTSELNWFGSARVRAGMLLTPALLVYATGGIAWADFDFGANGIARSETLFGYQLGAGTELMLSRNWSLRAEYIYTDLAPETFNHGAIDNKYDADFHTVRAGLSFKF